MRGNFELAFLLKKNLSFGKSLQTVNRISWYCNITYKSRGPKTWKLLSRNEIYVPVSRKRQVTSQNVHGSEFQRPFGCYFTLVCIFFNILPGKYGKKFLLIRVPRVTRSNWVNLYKNQHAIVFRRKKSLPFYTDRKNILKFQWIFTEGVEWQSYIIEINDNIL